MQKWVPKSPQSLRGSDWKHLNFWRMHYPKVKEFLSNETRTVVPPEQIRFKALELTKKKDVRIVFLAPRPYQRPGVANGLCLSTRAGNKRLPGPLHTLFAEYQRDLGYGKPVHGDLSGWARRGVLLLNCALTADTVADTRHQYIGWEKLTYEIIRRLSDRGNIFFCLFGKEAAAYEGAIDLKRNALMVLAFPGNIRGRAGLEDVYGSGLFSECAAYIGEDKSFWRLPGT